ncbi:MAG: winged helix-turn-helix domain-containing protein [Patescibacteria group bacterium]|nr:winged helix-turn-helix domain-containing protein [Patescibacteria group bacterium]
MEEKKKKGPKKLERHFKGVANHRRIQIILLIAHRPGMTLDEIVGAVKGNMKTIAEHTRRLTLAGLVEKTYAGRTVEHKLTPYGRTFVEFIETFSNS